MGGQVQTGRRWIPEYMDEPQVFVRVSLLFLNPRGVVSLVSIPLRMGWEESLDARQRRTRRFLFTGWLPPTAPTYLWFLLRTETTGYLPIYHDDVPTSSSACKGGLGLGNRCMQHSASYSSTGYLCRYGYYTYLPPTQISTNMCTVPIK